ncbi:B3 domain-containing protein [Canna indica]|uniref:B3 domain-containing protein n=1 Tax=Canna indica TaxID=4628 RepID=A0AAQ3KCM5_9LILI|nr:B3 domain-containing protein [Canna indica]
MQITFSQKAMKHTPKSDLAIQRTNRLTSRHERCLTNQALFSHPGKVTTNRRKRRNSKIGSPATKQKSTDLPIRTQQEEIVPLSGKPFFATVISDSQFHMTRMVVPKWLYGHLPLACVPIILSHGNRTWEAKYNGNQDFKRFSGGWRNFVNDNNLNPGDACIFELMDSKNVHFKVQILRGQEVPDLSGEDGDGQSSGTPILID